MNALWILASVAQGVIVLGTCYAIVKLAGQLSKDGANAAPSGAAEDMWLAEILSDDSADDYLPYDCRADKTEPWNVM